MSSTRVWAEIDTAVWRRNLQAIARAVAPAEVLAVVKANAYGLGVREAATAFREAGATHLAVACVEEGLQVAGMGATVFVLGASLAEEIPELVAADMIASVPDLEMATRISRVAETQRRRARVHIKVDTGMGRLGILVPEARRLIPEILRLPNLEVEGIYSHFPTAGVRDGRSHSQLDELSRLIHDLDAMGIRFRWRHLANSTAVAGLPASYRAPFNMVRPGIDLHGAHLSVTPRPYQTAPVLSVKSRLVAVRQVPAGWSISYGCTYRVTAAGGERIGTVCVGYADGYPRCLSNHGVMLVRGQRCPVVGRVCMDYTMISLAGVPDAVPGDEVVLIGDQGSASVTISEMARTAKTIPYELMCGLGPRVKRIYLRPSESESSPAGGSRG